MDLSLYFRVIWRFRLLVLAGVVLAAALAVLSVAKVSFAGGSPKLSYRKTQIWLATTTLFITQKGFPWGRVTFPCKLEKSGTCTSSFGDPGRFYALATIYAQIAKSDAIRQLMLRDGPIEGDVSAQAGVDSSTDSRAVLPLLDILGAATTQPSAARLANRAAVAVQRYVAHRQSAAGIAPTDRVLLQMISRARSADLVSTRKMTVPVVVFLAVLLATVGLAFVLENLRPRVRKVEAHADVDDEKTASARLSA